MNAIILLDEPGGVHFATLVEQQVKKIETRMKRMIPEGDIVICCSNGSQTKNKGLALCIVHAKAPRLMTKDDEVDAQINCIEGRYASELSNWRYFNRKFEFSKRKVSGTFQAIFQIEFPEGVFVK